MNRNKDSELQEISLGLCIHCHELLDSIRSSINPDWFNVIHRSNDYRKCSNAEPADNIKSAFEVRRGVPLSYER